MHNYRQCVRCVMDTSDPDIRFDKDGHCQHCTYMLAKRAYYEVEHTYDEEELKRLVYKIKKDGKGRKYDCLLGISGGVDSCYAAYILKQHGLRCLLVHMDNGWNAEEAVNNIRRVAERLGMDYESYVLDWEEFKEIQLAFLKASVVEADTPTDIAILGALHKVAADNNIKYIISGGNEATEGILPKRWHYNAKDTVFFNAVMKRFSKRKLKYFPMFGWKQELYYKFVKGIRIIYLLNYVPYRKQEVMQLLQEKLGWKYYGGKHYESRYTRFIQSYLLPLKFDLDYRKATFSSQICAGQMSREEALEQLKLPTYDPQLIEEDKAYIAKKLGISKEELEQIIHLPPKSYLDYPNDEERLEKWYALYRKYFSKTKVTQAVQH